MSDPAADSSDTAPKRNRRRAVALTVAAAVALLLVLRLGPSTPDTPVFTAEGIPRPIPENQLAPATLEEFEGMLVGLRGTPVIVNIWASWCAPCRAEMPLLERAAAEYEGDVVVLGVDSRDATEPAADFLDDVGVTYPNVFDRTGKIRRALALRGFPTTYFFDREGRIVATVVGGITEARLAAQLRALT